MSATAAPAVRQVQITFDCADPWGLSLFWNAAMGYVHPDPPPGVASWEEFAASLPPDKQNMAAASVDPSGSGPRLFFQQVPEDTRMEPVRVN